MRKTTWHDKLNTDQQALIEDILKQLPPSAVWGYEALLNKIAAPQYRWLLVNADDVQGTNDEDIVAAAEEGGDHSVVHLEYRIDEARREDWDIEEDEDEDKEDDE